MTRTADVVGVVCERRIPSSTFQGWLSLSPRLAHCLPRWGTALPSFYGSETRTADPIVHLRGVRFSLASPKVRLLACHGSRSPISPPACLKWATAGIVEQALQAAVDVPCGTSIAIATCGVRFSLTLRRLQACSGRGERQNVAGFALLALQNAVEAGTGNGRHLVHFAIERERGACRTADPVSRHGLLEVAPRPLATVPLSPQRLSCRHGAWRGSRSLSCNGLRWGSLLSLASWRLQGSLEVGTELPGFQATRWQWE